MADEIKFTEDGLELLHSVAEEMDGIEEEFAAAGLAMIPTIYGAALFVLKVIDLMQEDENTLLDAVRRIQGQIDELKNITQELNNRLNRLAVQLAIDSNRNTMRDLRTYIDDIRIAASDMQNEPVTLGGAVAMATRCGILVDRFLAGGLDIWRWADVVRRRVVHPSGTQQVTVEAVLGKFKNAPTLSAYLTGVLTWLAARERAVALGGRDSLQEDEARLRRHLTAVSSRPTFDRYGDDEPSPQSIAEQIKWRIHTVIRARTQYPDRGVCRFYFSVNNWMNGARRDGEDFDRLAADPHALCTIDPRSVGAPQLELDMEASAGISALEALEEPLRRALMTGSLREQQIGSFDMRFYDLNHIYTIRPNGDMHWYVHTVTRHGTGSTAPLSHSWYGPRRIGSGWQGFVNALPGGYRTIYGLRRNGSLQWRRHDGFMTGTAEWTGPREVGSGWEVYQRVIPSADGVLYGLTPNGTLFWHRQRGYDDGTAEWDGPIQVGTHWDQFNIVVSAGQGVLYAVRPNGDLLWYRHRGYLTGAVDWAGPTEVSVGWRWDLMQHLFSPGHQTLYGVDQNGDLYWYQHPGWLHGTAEWIGPVRMGGGWNNVRSLFARMSGAPSDDGIH